MDTVVLISRGIEGHVFFSENQFSHRLVLSSHFHKNISSTSLLSCTNYPSPCSILPTNSSISLLCSILSLILTASISPARSLGKTLSSTPSELAALHRRHPANKSSLAPKDQTRAKDILRWEIFVERPLTVHELTEALTLKDTDGRLPTHQIPSPLDPGQILPCGGWTLRLAHSSTKEHLAADRFREERVEIGGLADLIFDHHMNHGLLAKTCLSYQIIQDVKFGAGSVDRHSPSQWPPPAASTIHQDPTLSSYGLRSCAIQNGLRTSLQTATMAKSVTYTVLVPPGKLKRTVF